MRKFWSVINTRGGVEDIWLEANDTKQNRGQGQGPRKQAQMLSRRLPKKKRSSESFFRRSPEKNRFPKNFSGAPQTFNNSKIVLSSSRGQGNFRGLEAWRPRPRTSKCVLEDVLEAKDIHKDSISDKYTDSAKIKCKCS